LEELSVRADIALSQKKLIHEITAEGDDDDEFEEEFHSLSAQVVSEWVSFLGWSYFVSTSHIRFPRILGQGDAQNVCGNRRSG